MWLLPALLFLVLFLAMQVTDEVAWSTTDFVVAAVLLYGALGSYSLVIRLSNNSATRAGFGFGIGGTLVMLWANGAVGFTDSDADGAYLVLIVLAAVGAFLVKFQPLKMMYTMISVVVGHAFIVYGAYAAGIVPPHNSLMQLTGIVLLFGAPFVVAAAFFKKEADGQVVATESGDTK